MGKLEGPVEVTNFIEDISQQYEKVGTTAALLALVAVDGLRCVQWACMRLEAIALRPPPHGMLGDTQVHEAFEDNFWR
jgi:hypothetical protein